MGILSPSDFNHSVSLMNFYHLRVAERVKLEWADVSGHGAFT